MSILTTIEEATVFSCEIDDQNMLDLLEQVTAFVENATGWEWSQDEVINASAKSSQGRVRRLSVLNPIPAKTISCLHCLEPIMQIAATSLLQP